MYKSSGRFDRFGYNAEHKQQITLTIDGDIREYFDANNGKELEISINLKRKKRSLNANDYMWALLGQLSEVVNIPDMQLYRNAIREVGLYKDYHYLTEEEAKTLNVVWSNFGDGWFTRKLDYEPDGEHIILRCFYGSSYYNSKQMSRLIEYIVQDCKNVGIDTLTPSQRALLCEEWKGKKINDKQSG